MKNGNLIILCNKTDDKNVFIPWSYLSKMRPRLKIKLKQTLKMACARIMTLWFKKILFKMCCNTVLFKIKCDSKDLVVFLSQLEGQEII